MRKDEKSSLGSEPSEELKQLREQSAYTREMQRQKVLRNSLALDVILRNLHTPDFRNSRNALLLFSILPWSVRMYYWFAKRNRYLKGFLFYTTLLSTGSYLMYSIKYDSIKYAEKDDRDANQLRDIMLVESRMTLRAPDMEDQTLKIIEQRKKNAARPDRSI